MPKNLADHEAREEKDGAAPAGGGRAPGKNKLSTLKDYVIIILLMVLVFAGVNNYILARSEWGGAPAVRGGGCGGCGTRGGTPVSVEQLRRLGLEYYAANYGDSAVDAEVRDFGCHQEIYILIDGKLVLRLAHQGGELYELPEV